MGRMPRRLWSFIGGGAALACLVTAGTAGAQLAPLPVVPLPAPVTTPGPDYVPGELIVRYKPGTAASERSSLNAAQDARVRRGLELPRAYLLRLPEDRDVRAAQRAYERDPNVQYAEPNHILQLSATPNDPGFHPPYQWMWGLHNTGQDVFGTGPGTADADIDAPEAWDQTTGSSAVTVGVTDSGVAYDHPDLAGNIWQNPGESGSGKETNNIDDDGNGKVDDFRGWDFAENNNDPMDFTGHGTHVAGTIGATGNNGEGVPGVNWSVRIAPLQVCSPNPFVSCNAAALADAFVYAGQKGMQVVNASLGTLTFVQSIGDAIANAPNTLFVFAAGNSNSDNDTTPNYPCQHSSPNIICVAATDKNDNRASFSNYGDVSVDLAAPGHLIASTSPHVVPFEDTFELADFNTKWTTGGTNNTWARVGNCIPGDSGNCYLADSPAGFYLNNTSSWSGNTSAINTTGLTNCHLQFLVNWSVADDQLVVAGSTDGAGWTPLWIQTGASGGWQWVDLDGTGTFDGLPALYFRWWLITNSSATADGAYVDDVAMRCRRPTYASGLGYEIRSGTSMASPHVAGAAALAFAKVPGAAVLGVKSAILNGVETKPSLSGVVASGGRLNLVGMLTRLACCHVRPQAASPTTVSLVPAYNQCTSPNRVHGPPNLPGGGNPTDGSCAPPGQRSASATVGTPDANGPAANSVGSLRMKTIAGIPGGPDDADVSLSLNMTDVRAKTSGTPDYSGQLEARIAIRITDRRNGPGLNEAATVVDVPYEFVVPCATTASTTVGSTCSVSTAADAIQPGFVAEGARSVWELGQVHVADGGPDGAATTEPNTIFAVQGLFVP